ncbi:hypothetical protein [Vagococcus carniphilus]|uniref:PPM-type phosphatase domain-containing protein n=1 Tax=Vagococcus carniphilus TaxID=218144 RepID=A0A430B8P4_9ENTE|nr:hypothetical protein [Vagococcus carniphilus]QNN73750.1 hypothetical protein H9L18_03915 [Vagococcus carniphilus]RSU16724.1 hypothetical protein CBF28_00635 [Vagococcus carniphilus]
MNIIEYFSKGKSYNDEENEDGLYQDENFIAVIDGVTDKDSTYAWKDKPGKVCKDIIMKRISQLPHNINSNDFFYAITDAISAQYQENKNFFISNNNDRLQATIILFSAYWQEIWIYGDSKCLINHVEINNEKEIDKINGEIRSQVLTTYYKINNIPFSQILEEDIGRKAILPLLKNQSKLANSDHELGYPVLDGINFNHHYLKKITVSPNDTIVLASDGYPVLKNSLKESEKHLESIIELDPMMFHQYKSTKGIKPNQSSYDDRTYIKFIV